MNEKKRFAEILALLKSRVQKIIKVFRRIFVLALFEKETAVFF